MTYFKSADEVYEFIGGIFEKAAADPETGPKFAESGVVLKLNYTDPDASFVVDMPNQKVLYGAEMESVKPTIEMFMKSDVGHRFWMGKVNISMALAKGEMRAKGPVPKILKLVPLAKSIFPQYEEMVRNSGRDDLLNV